MERARVMIVEDEGVIAADLSDTVQAYGHQVCGTVDDGERAVAMAGETNPDVVLLDMRLRGKWDGVETAMHLRHGRRPAIIFLTAYADARTVHRVRWVEPEGYLLKPVNEKELAANIQIALFRRRFNQERQLLQQSLGRLASEVNELGRLMPSLVGSTIRNAAIDE